MKRFLIAFVLCWVSVEASALVATIKPPLTSEVLRARIVEKTMGVMKTVLSMSDQELRELLPKLAENEQDREELEALTFGLLDLSKSKISQSLFMKVMKSSLEVRLEELELEELLEKDRLIDKRIEKLASLSDPEQE